MKHLKKVFYFLLAAFIIACIVTILPSDGTEEQSEMQAINVAVEVNVDSILKADTFTIQQTELNQSEYGY